MFGMEMDSCHEVCPVVALPNAIWERNVAQERRACGRTPVGFSRGHGVTDVFQKAVLVKCWL